MIIVEVSTFNIVRDRWIFCVCYLWFGVFVYKVFIKSSIRFRDRFGKGRFMNFVGVRGRRTIVCISSSDLCKSHSGFYWSASVC